MLKCFLNCVVTKRILSQGHQILFQVAHNDIALLWFFGLRNKSFHNTKRKVWSCRFEEVVEDFIKDIGSFLRREALYNTLNNMGALRVIRELKYVSLDCAFKIVLLFLEVDKVNKFLNCVSPFLVTANLDKLWFYLFEDEHPLLWRAAYE